MTPKLALESERIEQARRAALDALDLAVSRGKDLDDKILAASISLFEARALKASLQGDDAAKELRRKVVRAFLLADWAAGKVGLSATDRDALRQNAVLEAGVHDDDLRVIALVREALLARGTYLMTEELEKELAASDHHALSLLSGDGAAADAILPKGFVPFKERTDEASP